MPNQEEQEPLKPIESEEELKEVNQTVQTAGKVKALIAHPGWAEVLMPVFDRQIDTLTKGILIEKDHLQIIRYQEAINGIKKMFDIINYYINEGRVAEQRIEKKKQWESLKKNE